MDPSPRQSTTPRPPGSFKTGPVTCMDTDPVRAVGQGLPPQTRAQSAHRPHPQVRGDQVGSDGTGGGWLFCQEPGSGPHGPPLGQLCSWTGEHLSEYSPCELASRGSELGCRPSIRRGPYCSPPQSALLCFHKSSRCGHTGDHGQSVKLCPRRGRLSSSASSGCLVHPACRQGHCSQTHAHTV